MHHHGTSGSRAAPVTLYLPGRQSQTHWSGAVRRIGFLVQSPLGHPEWWYITLFRAPLEHADGPADACGLPTAATFFSRLLAASQVARPAPQELRHGDEHGPAARGSTGRAGDRPTLPGGLIRAYVRVIYVTDFRRRRGSGDVQLAVGALGDGELLQAGGCRADLDGAGAGVEL
jgi:hypothetical protein